jgi:hypothetical protein
MAPSLPGRGTTWIVVAMLLLVLSAAIVIKRPAVNKRGRLVST